MDCKSEHISNLRLNIQVLWKEPQIFVSNHKTQKAQSLEVVLRPQSCAEASFKGRQPLQQTKQAQPLRLLLGLYEHAFAASKARKKERQPLEASNLLSTTTIMQYSTSQEGALLYMAVAGKGGKLFCCVHGLEMRSQHWSFTTKQAQPTTSRVYYNTQMQL